MPPTFWVIIFVPFVLLFLLLFFITLNRYIAYKERIALARLGYPPETIAQAQSRRQGGRGVLWGGVITGMSGLALLLGLSTLGTGAWLLAGLLPLFVGLGMVVVYFVTPGTPPPERQAHDVITAEGSSSRDAQQQPASELGHVAGNGQAHSE